uniref:Uncharacterized protein n=1 Tax=Anopheles atroparvus TaxID=41427 RepID=A0A182IRF7_ANOAO
MMNFCGWLKVFKRKEKQPAGEGGREDGDNEQPPGENASSTGERRWPANEKRANIGRSVGGWKRKIKSVTKQSGTERTSCQQEQEQEREAANEEIDTKLDGKNQQTNTVEAPDATDEASTCPCEELAGLFALAIMDVNVPKVKPAK